MGTEDEIIPDAVVKMYENVLSGCSMFEKTLLSGRRSVGKLNDEW